LKTKVPRYAITTSAGREELLDGDLKERRESRRADSAMGKEREGSVERTREGRRKRKGRGGWRMEDGWVDG
jgi:hypothetical protein